jgi:hypothetical protein
MLDLSNLLLSSDNFLKTFFQDVEMVKSHLAHISQATDNLREIQNEVCFPFLRRPSHRTARSILLQPLQKKKKI